MPVHVTVVINEGCGSARVVFNRSFRGKDALWRADILGDIKRAVDNYYSRSVKELHRELGENAPLVCSILGID